MEYTLWRPFGWVVGMQVHCDCGNVTNVLNRKFAKPFKKGNCANCREEYDCESHLQELLRAEEKEHPQEPPAPPDDEVLEYSCPRCNKRETPPDERFSEKIRFVNRTGEVFPSRCSRCGGHYMENLVRLAARHYKMAQQEAARAKEQEKREKVLGRVKEAPGASLLRWVKEQPRAPWDGGFGYEQTDPSGGTGRQGGNPDDPDFGWV